MLGFHYHGPGSIPGWGTEIPQVEQCGQKKRHTNELISETEIDPQI